MKKTYFFLTSVFLAQTLMVVAPSTPGLLPVGYANEKAMPSSSPVAQAPKSSGIHWVGWSDDLFERAQKEKKYVVLDLEAVWCHWCHVMEEKTYSDPKVIDYINKHYIAVRVDQDSRPDLSNRYMDYGWPATIFFAPDGKELVKRSGFIPPTSMATILDKVVKNPTPEEVGSNPAEEVKTYAKDPVISEELRHELEEQHVANYDENYGSWGSGSHKFLDWDSVEYSLMKAKDGDKDAEKMARKTLQEQMNILDPVWGGMYQYSTGGTWKNPHYEKIMSVQAENMRIYAQAYAQYKDPSYLKTAEAIHGFLKNFLSGPEGAFYTSMDADVVQGEHSDAYFQLNDTDRRKQGIPRIDKHQYARENGWVINALASLYDATGDKAYLDEAVQAAQWVIAHRSLPGGGYRHDEKDVAGPYLGDTLSMGRAFVSLYRSTGDRQWIVKAQEAADYINQNFAMANGTPGFVSAVSKSTVVKPLPLRDENVLLARFANNLFHSTGNQKYRDLSDKAMRFIATPEIARIPFSATTLLPDYELSKDPTHITIVGHKDDPVAQSLFQAARSYPSVYKRLDWWDKREGPMPNPDVQYPELDKPAAFICTEKRCSLPVFKPEALGPLVDRLTASSSPQKGNKQ
jgi:uncharacterized protein